MLFRSDEDAWNRADPKDLWVMDKLILAKTLGYTCGPKGVDVPRPDKYIIRPVVNALGMGLGARTLHIKKSTSHIPDGFFWCEIFEGDHSSIDYRFSQEVLYVTAKTLPGYVNRFDCWQKELFKTLHLPGFLDGIARKYEFVNVERVGSKIIEVHLRQNPDFVGHDSDYVRPVYTLEESFNYNEKREEYIYRPDGPRLGFIIRRQA